MKHLLFLLFPCWFSGFLGAQGADFAPLGAKWYYDEEAFIPPPFGVFPHVVEVVAKEVYQGVFCSKLAGVGSETVPDPLYVFSRNDSVFYYSDRSAQFELLYDFTAEAGDSWTVAGLRSTETWDRVTVLVDSVATIEVSGISRKAIYISYSQEFYPYDWEGVIVEGIGSMYFLVPDFGLYEGGPLGIRCYTDMEVDLHFVSYPCDAVVSANEVLGPVQDWSISPNPADETLTIQWTEALSSGRVILTDMIGRVVQTTAFSGQGTSLNTAAVPDGVYLLRI